MLLLMVLKDHWELRIDMCPESLKDREGEARQGTEVEINRGHTYFNPCRIEGPKAESGVESELESGLCVKRDGKGKVGAG